MATETTLTIRNDAGVILQIEGAEHAAVMTAIERATPGAVNIKVTPESSHVHAVGDGETMQSATDLLRKMEDNRPVNTEQTRHITTFLLGLAFLAVVLTGYTLTLTFGHGQHQVEQSR